MKKYADKYLEVDPWLVIESSFDPSYARVSESLFSLGNEYMGIRGYFEEGYSGDSLQGSYVNGIYGRRSIPKSGYCGMLDSTEFMINTVDWLYLRLSCNGEKLDLAQCKTENFVRTLDLSSGVLTRSFIWALSDGTKVKICFDRFLSMEQPEFGGQRMTINVLEGTANLQWAAGLDFSRPHISVGANLWDCDEIISSPDFCALTGTTQSTQQKIYAACTFQFEPEVSIESKQGKKLAASLFSLTLQKGEHTSFTKIAAIVCCRSIEDEDAFIKRRQQIAELLPTQSFDKLKKENASWWKRQWKISDIQIEGDDENQQGIRYCIFQMHQTLHTARYGAIIGAKGLTGEMYNGNTFWDTEVYCLPFYVFNNIAAAKSILQFRYDTLPQARKRAASLDCKGAFYPIATISGLECCDLWQHASLQLQASTGVMYGLQTYMKITDDRDFLYHQGIEMLVEISRMLATRGAWNSQTGAYGFYSVMGPDEFQMMVNNNAYTNFMAKKTFLYTIKTLADLYEESPDQYGLLFKKLAISSAELVEWKEKAERMEMKYDAKDQLFEQQDGFFSLPHVDINSISVDQFPLYSHWSYERIYRNDMLKQPDVLMFMLMYASEFSNEQLEQNYNYYEPRCIHESSLSPSVHSILAQQLGKEEDAYRFFQFSTRMDMDNYNRNTCEGLRTTSIAGAWMNVVYGYGGLRSDGEKLVLNPSIPEGWQSYSFCLLYKNSIIQVHTSVDKAELKILEGESVELVLYGETVTIGAEPIIRPIPIRRAQ